MGCLLSCIGYGNTNDKPEPMKDNKSNTVSVDSALPPEAEGENPEEGGEQAGEAQGNEEADPTTANEAKTTANGVKSSVDGHSKKIKQTSASRQSTSKATKKKKASKSKVKESKVKEPKSKEQKTKESKLPESKAPKPQPEVDPYSQQESYNTSINVSTTVLEKAQLMARCTSGPKLTNPKFLKQSPAVKAPMSKKNKVAKGDSKKVSTSKVSKKKQRSSKKNVVKSKQTRKKTSKKK